MASCPAGGKLSLKQCRGCINELALLAWYVGTPSFPDKILPQPEWCQEAAMVGLLIDKMRETDETSPE